MVVLGAGWYVFCVVYTGRDVLQWKWCGAILPEGIHSVQGMKNEGGGLERGGGEEIRGGLWMGRKERRGSGRGR